MKHTTTYVAFDNSKDTLAVAIADGGLRCESAWNKDPVFGVIGIQSGPRG